MMHFEFISNYDGVTDFRLYKRGQSDTRIRVQGNVCTYSDGSSLLRDELAAFNSQMRAKHDAARLAYPEHAPEFAEYTTGEHV